MSILSRLRTPLFQAGGIPRVTAQTYRLEVAGLAQGPQVLAMEEILALPQSTVNARLTSVSGWSVRTLWQGVLWRDFLAAHPALPEADHATFISLGGVYTTTVSLADLDHPRVLLAHAVEDEPLELEYGGPLRMVIPHRYGYKSAKWLGRIEYGRGMRGGYWEDRGYTRSGQIESGLVLDVNTGQRRQIAGGEVTEF